MKRKLKWLSFVLAILLLGFGTALLLWPRDRISAESWEKIRVGMTEKEVADFLGQPSGMSLDQLQGHHFNWFSWLVLVEPINYDAITVDVGWNPRPGLNQDTHKFWTSQRHCLQIGFDGTGKVRGKVLWESNKPSSFIDRIRDWLGW
jgi:hypothetical protein